MPVSTEYDGEEAYQMRIIAKRYAQKLEIASRKQQARNGKPEVQAKTLEKSM